MPLLLLLTAMTGWAQTTWTFKNTCGSQIALYYRTLLRFKTGFTFNGVYYYPVYGGVRTSDLIGPVFIDPGQTWTFTPTPCDGDCDEVVGVKVGSVTLWRGARLDIKADIDCNGIAGSNVPGLPDRADRPPDPGCPPGMPSWSVSEPFINLWLEDEPLGYQPGLGPRISFGINYKQRESTTGFDTNTFSVGKKWDFAWLSYVAQDTNTDDVVYFAGGGSSTYTNGVDYLTNTRLSGDTTNGFTLAYPDGRKTVYGLVVTNGSGIFQKAFMTEQWNAVNQKTRLDYYSYTPANIVIRLKDVVDGDGRTNLVSYVSSNGYSTNLISQVVDAFNRTNKLAYDGSGHLTNITDVAGLSSWLAYDTNDWVTNMITPYGTTTFIITDAATQIGGPDGRSILVGLPDGSHELYLYRDGYGSIPQYTTNYVPSTLPFTNSFDNSDMDSRNTFHWDRLQYTLLSTSDFSAFTDTDYLSGRMRHWLSGGDGTVSSTLSLERAPSPDSSTEGQKTWFDHAGKTNSEYAGTQVLPLCAARLLPDSTSWYDRTVRNFLGTTTNEVSTYSIGSTIYQRTNTYAYATNGIDLLTVTNALGVQVSSNAFNSYHQVTTNFNALNEKTVYTYNASNQLTSITRPNGLVTTNLYFTAGFTNWLATNMDFSGSTYFRTNSFTYSNGLVYSQTDERGLTVTNFWDNLQRLTGRLYPDGTTISNRFCRLDGQSYPNSSGGTNILDLTAVKDRLGNWTYSTYDAVRQQTLVTNALGVVTAYGYCNCGALEYLTNALGKTEQLVTHYVHDNQGNVTSIFYPDGSGTTNQFDSLGRVTNALSGFASVTNYFNNQGLLITASNAFGQAMSATFDILDRATNRVDANGVTITNTFDNLNRLLTKGHPDGGVEKYGYTANIAGLTSYTNQLGSNVVNCAYDLFGRKTNEVNPGITTNSFAYDASGSLTSLTDGKGQITSWHFDQYGRPTNKVDATSTEILRYQYDADGRLTNRWSAAKGNTTYQFDAVGNLTNTVYPVSPAITRSYDALNRLANMVDAVGTTVYGYASQFLASEDGPWDSDMVSYSYANDLRSGLTLLQPNATSWTQSYSYDGANRLSSLTSPAGAFTATFKGPGNLMTNLALPNGSAITNAFDNVARLTGTWLKKNDGTILNSHTYGYNAANQRTAVTNFAGNYLNYTYDLIGELKTAAGKESGGSSRSHEQFGYVYDAAGNLNYRTNNALIQTFGVNSLNELSTVTRSGTLTVAGTTTSTATNVTVNSLTATLYNDQTFAKDSFTVTNGNNKYVAIAQDSYNRKDTNSVTFNLPATNSYAHDANGNLTSDGTRGFDYDDENQLIRVTVTNSWKTEFTYDGKFRQRIRKEFTWKSSAWVQTNEVHYVYDGNAVIQWRDANNLPTLTLTRNGGRLLARSDMTAVTPSHAYFHADGNRNVTALIDGQQTIVARYVYDPFGNTLSFSGPLATANLYRFASQELHPNSGLIYFGRRFYDPNLQRWINRDPIAEFGGANLFAYCRNNPISLIDSLGLSCPPSSLWYPNMPSSLWDLNIYFRDLYGDEIPGGNQIQWSNDPLLYPYGPDPFAVPDTFAEDLLNLLPFRQNYIGLKDDINNGDVLSGVGHALGLFGEGILTALTAGQASEILGLVRAGSVMGEVAAENTALSTYRVTAPGETFIRYESANPAFTRITPGGGVTPGTFAAPASDGLIPLADRVPAYNLPSPQIPRPNAITLTPPPGTPIIGPRPVVGGTGNEVIFPMGY